MTESYSRDIEIKCKLRVVCKSVYYSSTFEVIIVTRNLHFSTGSHWCQNSSVDWITWVTGGSSIFLESANLIFARDIDLGNSFISSDAFTLNASSEISSLFKPSSFANNSRCWKQIITGLWHGNFVKSWVKTWTW